jgi:hypothetical protein
MMETGKMECVMAMDYADGWDQWKAKFKDALKQGRKFGLSDETIKTMSVKIGDFLATKLCAHTKEEALMHDLWATANTDERKVLAGLVFKMIDK